MIQITNHVQRGLGRLPEFFKRKPKVRAFLSALLEEVQELEDAIWSLRLVREIETSFGAALDQWGKRLGKSRDGKPDSRYKQHLKARLQVLRASGTIPEVLRIFRLLAPDATVIRNRRYFPAAFELRIEGAAVPEGEELAGILQEASVDGVRAVLVWPYELPSFGFDGDPTASGFSLSTDPTLGGRFVRAVG